MIFNNKYIKTNKKLFLTYKNSIFVLKNTDTPMETCIMVKQPIIMLVEKLSMLGAI